MHRLDRVHGVETMCAWRGEIEFLAELIEKVFSRLFPNPHRAIALHVAVAAHRAQARSRFAKLTAQQHQVNDLLNIRHGVLVLRQAHSPTKDHPLRLDENARGIFKLTLLDSALVENVAQMNLRQRSFEFIEAARVFFDKLAIQNLAGPPLFGIEKFLHDAFYQSHVTVDADLDE